MPRLSLTLGFLVALHAASAIAAPAPEGSTSTSSNRWIIENNDTHKRQTLDATGVLAPWLAGGGVHFAMPIVQDGFLPKINDSFDLEVSAHLVYWIWGRFDYMALIPLAGVRWQFHLTPQWSVFGIAKSGLVLGFGEGVFFGHEFGVGAYWHFAQDMSLRLEAGSLGLIMVGISLPI